MKPNSATYRAILDSFWTNVNILDLLPEEKLFYLWSFTNSHLDTCGCYQVSVKTIAHETGFTLDQVMDLIDRFTATGKIKYCESTKELLLLKWKKNNSGFFKPENKNSIKSMFAGASKIKSPELKSIVMGWLNNESDEGAYQGGSEGAYLPPTQGAEEGTGVEGGTQPLTINHKPVTLTTKEEERGREVKPMAMSDIQKLHVDYLGKIPANQPVASILRDICREYPPDRITIAFQRCAVSADKPNLNWIKSYLDNPKNWNKGEANGRDTSDTAGSRTPAAKAGRAATGIIPPNSPDTDWVGGSSFAADPDSS